MIVYRSLNVEALAIGLIQLVKLACNKFRDSSFYYF